MNGRDTRADASAFPAATGLALFVLSGAGLCLELTLVRLLSVAMWYPIAYLAIGCAMLGVSAGAALASVWSRLRELPSTTALSLSATGFAVTTAGGYPLWNALQPAPMSIVHAPTQALLLAVVWALLTLPFVFVGTGVTRVFASWPARSGILYGIDLAGAAVGVAGYILALSFLGGPGALMASAALAALGGALVAPTRLLRGACGGLVGVLSLVALIADAALPVYITPNKMLGRGNGDYPHKQTHWHPSARVDWVQSRRGAFLLLDGGTALTPVATRGNATQASRGGGLRALPYQLSRGNKTLVVGSGGGLEVKSALDAGARRVVALEINPVINRLVRGPLRRLTGGLFSHPAVAAHVAEARAYLEAHPERFDVITAFHTISNAALGTGAMALAENYLLTRESLRLLRQRLRAGGVLLMTRPESQMPRLVSTLASGWQQESALGEHVAVVSLAERSPAFVAGLLFRQQPFDARAHKRLQQHVHGRVLYAPDGSGEQQALYGALLARPTSAPAPAAAAAVAELPYRAAQLHPATDDRPFFNLAQPWRAVGLDDLVALIRSGSRARRQLESLPVAQLTVLVLLAQVLVLGSAMIVGPWRALRRQRIPRAKSLRAGTYFAAIALAYMAVELLLIQTLTRLLGEPVQTMLAILSTFVLGSAAGSMVWVGLWRVTPRVGAALGCATAVAAAWAAPALVNAGASWDYGFRLVAVAGLSLTVGFGLGGAMSAGLRALQSPALVPWAWAVNGVGSLGGNVLALVAGSAIGLHAATLGAGLLYAIGVLAALPSPAARGGGVDSASAEA